MINSWNPLPSKLGISLLVFICLPVAMAKTKVVESVLALVNEEPIYQSEFEEFRERLEQGIYTDDLVIPDEEARQKALKDKSFLLEKLIQSKVIDSEIKKLDLQVTEEQLDQEIRKIAGQNRISVSQMNAELRRQGFDLAEYRDMMRKNLKRRILIEREVTSKVKVSEDEVADYIQKNFNKQFSSEIFEYQLAHILIRTSSRSDQEAKARAQTVFNKLQEGASFEELASDFSEDPNFSQGGKIGTFQASELTPEFQQALNGLNTGAVSQPVQSEAGFHLLKIVNKKVIPDPRVESFKQRAQEELYAKNFQNQFEFWMRQRRADASVRINSR